MFDLQALAYQRRDHARRDADVRARYQRRDLSAAAAFATASTAPRTTPTLAPTWTQFALINKYHVQMLAYFLDKLQSTPDGDGTLLDHSMVLYGSSMSNGNQHDHDPLPVVVVGGASGQLKGGRHIVAPAHTPMSNLLLTLLDKLGVQQKSFGDSTAKLEI